MENIFKGAKFGDRYKTKSGKSAVYVENRIPSTHKLLVEQGISYIEVPYMDDGTCYWQKATRLNIVKKFDEIETTRIQMIGKACKTYCDLMCERGMCGMCYHKHDHKGQIKNDFKYNECNELQLIRREMETD